MLKNSKATYMDKCVIAGHYVFSNKRVLQLKKILNKKLKKKKTNLDKLLKKEISKTIYKYLKSFRLI